MSNVDVYTILTLLNLKKFPRNSSLAQFSLYPALHGFISFTTPCGDEPFSQHGWTWYFFKIFELYHILNMDLPHNLTSPEKLYEEVSSKVTNLWHYIQKRDIPGLKLELQWKKQCYGPKSYCHCNQEDCNYSKYVLKESTVIVKNDFGLEAFKLFILNEKSWIENFSKD